VQRLVGWAKLYNISIFFDLHAAPGSQNGWDNSGRLGPAVWGANDTLPRTYDVLGRLSQHILQLENDNTTSGVVVGLELLNEPFAPNMVVQSTARPRCGAAHADVLLM
jgi:glucan 1,3-beta-glucosidase